VRQQLPGNESWTVNDLLAEMNRNNGNTIKLLDRIVSEGCNRLLQVDTIKLVANMSRNIQISNSIMVRMSYNIHKMRRAPKAMNDIPFMTIGESAAGACPVRNYLPGSHSLH
jgi:hypothetical protein